MSKEGFIKLSEAELIKKIAKREKIECYLKVLGGDALIIGLVGAIIFKLVGIEVLMTLFLLLCCSGLVAVFLGVVQADKTRSLVNEQMGNFYEAELQKAFGPRLRTSEMSINSQLIKKLRPIDENWNECDVWRFYEGNYHGTTSLPLM